ncbi:DUF3081 family protein [Ferrimonas sp.]|uniref:DUF3081 family protein n=1 Tax=Ferrimonas sp. TaxID=2080861 RepID=UPI003A90E124
MRNQLDTRRLLQVYQKVCDLGVPGPQGYQFKGVLAWRDFDGYTLFLSDQVVTLTLLFHNRYQLDYPDGAALDQFLVRIEAVATAALTVKS